MAEYGSEDDIVSRLLERGREVALKTAGLAAEFSRKRQSVRAALEAGDEIEALPQEIVEGTDMPLVSAVDGGLAFESKAIGDICAAVGVELRPDGSQRNEVFMDTVTRNARNREILTGVMAGMEIRLAAASGAELVMIDGSLDSGLISLSKAISHSVGRANALEEFAMSLVCQEMRDAVMEILTSKRHVAIPKYTTKPESDFVPFMPESLKDFDGRTVATMALRPGEMMRLFNTGAKEQAEFEVARRRHGNFLRFPEKEFDVYVKSASSIVHSYYRPHLWTPAFRFDVPFPLYDDRDAGLRVLKALHDTTLSAGMREPLPLYVVDLFAKQISVGVSPITEMAAVNYEEEDDALILMIMGYRT